MGLGIRFYKLTMKSIAFLVLGVFTVTKGKLQQSLPQALHLELRFVTCNGAEENQAHRCDPYDLRVQEQPLFLVCSSINIFTSMGLDP